jgi:uncharacterized lipoprotein YehR (DUF1307 family)
MALPHYGKPQKGYYRTNEPYIDRSTIEPDVFIVFVGDIVEGKTSTHTIAFSIDTADNNRIDNIFKTDDLSKRISINEMEYMDIDLKNKINTFKNKTFDELCNIVTSSKGINKFKL